MKQAGDTADRGSFLHFRGPVVAPCEVARVPRRCGRQGIREPDEEGDVPARPDANRRERSLAEHDVSQSPAAPLAAVSC